MDKFEHTVGSHSDDRGGDSDRRCDCQDNPTPTNKTASTVTFAKRTHYYAQGFTQTR
jgi:hypothetical protein